MDSMNIRECAYSVDYSKKREEENVVGHTQPYLDSKLRYTEHNWC
jgi:hypothetical protein